MIRRPYFRIGGALLAVAIVVYFGTRPQEPGPTIDTVSAEARPIDVENPGAPEVQVKPVVEAGPPLAARLQLIGIMSGTDPALSRASIRLLADGAWTTGWYRAGDALFDGARLASIADQYVVVRTAAGGELRLDLAHIGIASAHSLPYVIPTQAYAVLVDSLWTHVEALRATGAVERNTITADEFGFDSVDRAKFALQHDDQITALNDIPVANLMSSNIQSIYAGGRIRLAVDRAGDKFTREIRDGAIRP